MRGVLRVFFGRRCGGFLGELSVKGVHERTITPTELGAGATRREVLFDIGDGRGREGAVEVIIQRLEDVVAVETCDDLWFSHKVTLTCEVRAKP